MDKPESFEVQQYNEVREPYDTFQTIVQVAQEVRDTPHVATQAFKVEFLGDLLKVTLTLFEMHLPSRMKEVQDMANKLHKSYMSALKKGFKKRAGHDLKLKEIKDREDYTVQKVSLNERYYYVCWHVYELDV